MAIEYEVDVVLDPKPAERDAKKIENALGRIADRADSIGPVLRRALGALTATLSVRAILDQANAYQNLQNRLRVVVGGTGALADVTEKLFAVAQTTRSSFQGTVELYSRLANSSKELGVSQDDLLKFTERVNKAIILSGASATEAQAGLIQLAQGLASGALRGDELRSVLEQLPTVADTIAKSLGITRGELRKLGGEGKITAQVVLDAFIKAGDGIDRDFQKTVPTLGQAFTALGNSVLKFVGEADQASGVTKAISAAVLLAAENVDVLAVAILGLSTAILGNLAAKALPAFLGQMSAVAKFATTNPFALIGVGAAVTVGIITKLTDEVEKYNEVQKQISGEGEGSALTSFGKVGERIANAQKQLVGLNKLLQGQQAAGTDTSTTLIVIKQTEERLASLRGESVKLTDQFKTQQETNTKLSASFQDMVKSLEQEAEALKLVGREREVREQLLKAEKALGKDGTQLTPTLRADLEARIRSNLALEDQAKVLEDILGPQEEYARKLAALKSLLDAGTISQQQFNAAASELKVPQVLNDNPFADPNKLQRLRPNEVPVPRIGEDQVLFQDVDRRTGGAAPGTQYGPELPEAGTDLGRRLSELQQIQGPMQDYQNSLAAVKELYAQGSITAQEAQVAVDRLVLSGASGSTTMADGFSRAFARIREEARDLSSVVEGAFGSITNRATDELVRLAETGKFSFQDLARAVVADLIRITARLLIVQALAAATGLGGGAVVNTAANIGAQQLEGRASGGPVQSNRSYLVGEEGPEIVRMGRAGSVVPNPSSVPSPPPEVNVSVINVTDENEIEAQLNSGRLDRAVLNVLSRNPSQANRVLGNRN